jgi:biotin carboxyl carrier protein
MKKYELKIGGKDYKVEIKDFTGKNAKVEVNGKSYAVDIAYTGGEAPKPVAAPRPSAAAIAPVQQQAAPAPVAGGNAIYAPMPGLILKVLVKPGDTVTVGQKIMNMEAMKMENDINTTFAGTVAEVRVKEGENVKENQVLITIQ